jgi:poly(3-hydroxybutyrate) depolymerase
VNKKGRDSVQVRHYSNLNSLCLIALVLLFTGTATAEVRKETFSSENKKRTYYLYVPQTLKPAEAAPLIILLHGSGRNGLSLVDKWKDLADQEGMILAGPDAARPEAWTTASDGPNVLRDLVETIKAKYPINPRRVYLFGHSAGAVYSLGLGLMESEYFAAVAIHAGGWREKSEFELLKRGRRKIPIAIWVGDRDQYFSLNSVHATRDALLAGGFPVELTEMPNHDHWYYDLAPKINQAAWQFLQRYELPAAPHFEPYASGGDNRDLSKVMADINALQAKVNQVTHAANERDAKLNAKDFTVERSEVNQLAQDEAVLLKEAAETSRTAADKASQAATNAKLNDRYKQFLTLIGQQNLKYAEMLDTKREEVELFLGNDPLSEINAKRSELQKKIKKLQDESDAFQQQAEKLIH